MAGFDSWIGRTIVQRDTVDPALARRWLAAFDLKVPADGIVPQGMHFCLCVPEAATSALGEDGHPERDDSPDSFLPPVALPRRMWAASDIRFLAPIAIGAEVKRTSTILSIAEKQGASGKLAFVEVEHSTKAGEIDAVQEVQTLVYREAALPDAPLTPPPTSDAKFEPGTWRVVQTIIPDPRLLFRYSALTFNTHRIHYDEPYARQTEKYRGLVVHGPLMATLLMHLCEEQYGPNCLASFAFRAVSPAIAGEPVLLGLRDSDNGLELGCFANDGRQILTATAQLA